MGLPSGAPTEVAGSGFELGLDPGLLTGFAWVGGTAAVLLGWLDLAVGSLYIIFSMGGLHPTIAPGAALRGG